MKLWKIKYKIRTQIERSLRKVRLYIRGFYRNVKRIRHVRQVNKIVKKEGNGIFYTHQLLEDAHWYDIYFVSEWEGKPTAWNATIQTTKMAYHEKIGNIAFTESWEAWPNKLKDSWSFVPIEGSKHLRMVDNEPEITQQRRGYDRAREIELYESGQVRIAPWHYEIDESYAFGVGLEVRLNVPTINEEVINDFIRVFSEKGKDVFDDRDNTPIAFSMEEVGVEVDEETGHIIWVDGTGGGSVALNIDLSDEAE